MSLLRRLTRAPVPHDPVLGAEAAARFGDWPAELRDLIAGAAGCSPYLAGLLAREADWLDGAVDDPEATREAVLAAIPALDGADLGAGLRIVKRRIALLVALADLGGVWPLEDVTGTLTRLADAVTDAALRATVGQELTRGKLPAPLPDRAEDGTGGMVALAMGKMGAHELNYSSDIDLICLFDDTRYAGDDLPEVRAALVRATRRMAALIGDSTAEGYVFRTDLRLRPDASVTPVVIPMAMAERYYESVGRTWERAAYIKARAAAGDIAAGEGFLASLTPFVWRRHLDFAAIEDAHQMRLRIRADKKLYGAGLDGLNLKLGRGGIREIEFFAQTRQLIAGGRDPTLRHRGTEAALRALAEAGWVPDPAVATLTGHYRAHREIEHRLQMIADAQTHDLPRDAKGWDRLAAFTGGTAADLRRSLAARLEEVHALTEGFFAPDAAPAPRAGVQELDLETKARWLTYPALRSERAVTIFHRLLPQLLTHLSDAARPEEALARFDGFLSGLPAGVQLFSLFEANPELIRLIADICATSPALASHLSRNAAVFDAVIGGDFFADWPGPEALGDSFGGALAGAGDYEGKLDAARRWLKEWHFRVGVHLLRGLIDAETSGRQFADLAGAVVAGLWPVVSTDFAAKHGPPPGRGAAVIGMGSLGAGWLTATSDLDLIVIYDAGDVEASDGRRPLPSRTYYARLTQALVTALSAPMAEGRLYEVDMRLRPSGKQGPVATSWPAFTAYQREDAWTWEHLALTRARVVAGEPVLGADIEAFRRVVLAEKAGGANVAADVAEMRRRLAEARPGSPWDAKAGPGRLTEIELLASMGALRSGSAARDPMDQIDAAVAAGLLGTDHRAALGAAHGLFRSVQATARLLTGGVVDPETVGEGGRRLILRETGGADVAALTERMGAVAASAATAIDVVLGSEGAE